MGLLDVTSMYKNKQGTWGKMMPPEVLSYVRKVNDESFVFLLDLEQLPKDRRYIQISVDFGEHKAGPTDDFIIRLSQMGNPAALIPQEALEGPPASYPYEQWRKEQADYDDGPTREPIGED